MNDDPRPLSEQTFRGEMRRVHERIDGVQTTLGEKLEKVSQRTQNNAVALAELNAYNKGVRDTTGRGPTRGNGPVRYAGYGAGVAGAGGVAWGIVEIVKALTHSGTP